MDNGCVTFPTLRNGTFGRPTSSRSDQTTPLGFYMFALRAEPYFINRREQIVQLDEPHRWPYSPSHRLGARRLSDPLFPCIIINYNSVGRYESR
jgi:hypothetical protein